MEVPADVLQGLGLAGESKYFGDAAFGALVDFAFAVVLRKATEGSIEESKHFASTDKSILKKAYSSLVGTILEAARRNTGDTEFGSFLEDSKIGGTRQQHFATRYALFRAEIRALLATTSFSFPHVVDVDWRLDYNVKNNQVERVDQPVFLVSLRTEGNNGAAGKPVEFSCSVDQLQDIVNRLKEACKVVERAEGDKPEEKGRKK